MFEANNLKNYSLICYVRDVNVDYLNLETLRFTGIRLTKAQNLILSG